MSDVCVPLSECVSGSGGSVFVRMCAGVCVCACVCHIFLIDSCYFHQVLWNLSGFNI